MTTVISDWLLEGLSSDWLLGAIVISDCSMGTMVISVSLLGDNQWMGAVVISGK